MRSALLLLSLSLCLREPRRSRYCPPPSSSSFLPLFLFLRSNFQLGTALGKGRGGEGVFGVTLCVAPLWKGEGGFRLGRGREEKGEGGRARITHAAALLTRKEGCNNLCSFASWDAALLLGEGPVTREKRLCLSANSPPSHPSSVHTPTSVRAHIAQELFSFSFFGCR